MLKLSVDDVNTYFWLVWDGQETATCTPRVYKMFTFFYVIDASDNRKASSKL